MTVNNYIQFYRTNEEQKELDMLKQKFGMSDEQVEMIAEQVRVENQEKEEKAQLEKSKR